MGLTAIVSSSASASSSSASVSVASLTSPVGLGVGGIFVAAALILLLSYFDMLEAADDANESIRMTLVASIVPLTIAFAGVVTFQTFAFV